jgi:RNA polymerase subunit RPABC4/transcription elongation factor Spt4
MATMNCRDCGTVISKTARRCPQCGGKQRRPVKTLSAIFVILIGLVALSGHLSTVM